jgi:hypothetical protein
MRRCDGDISTILFFSRDFFVKLKVWNLKLGINFGLQFPHKHIKTHIKRPSSLDIT